MEFYHHNLWASICHIFQQQFNYISKYGQMKQLCLAESNHHYLLDSDPQNFYENLTHLQVAFLCSSVQWSLSKVVSLICVLGLFNKQFTNLHVTILGRIVQWNISIMVSWTHIFNEFHHDFTCSKLALYRGKLQGVLPLSLPLLFTLPGRTQPQNVLVFRLQLLHHRNNKATNFSH